MRRAEAAVLALAMQEYSEARRGLNAVSPDLGSLTSANETEAVALNPFDPFNFTMLNAWLSVLSGTLICKSSAVCSMRCRCGFSFLERMSVCPPH